LSQVRLLVVAGHDPTGGAGVAADREAALAFGAEPRTVVTAWTHQDGRRVSALGARSPREWLAEARSELFLRSPPRAIKSGLLPGAEHVRALAALVREARERLGAIPVVVDPVLRASGGEEFLSLEGQSLLLAELVPLGVILTPNLFEAARLTGLDDLALGMQASERLRAASALLARGAAAVLVKGGHGIQDRIQDLCMESEGEPRWHVHARVAGRGLHGSGCRYASAVAAQLARGFSLDLAFRQAGDWLARRIAQGPQRPA
jgi:hydroxymethylpyrimidine/phosphomethylpyrimidine kinase